MIDTFLVKLERSQVCIDGNGNWTDVGDSSFESTFVLVFDVIASRDGGTNVVFVKMAGSIDTPEITSLFKLDD